MSSTIAQTLSLHRESVSSALQEGRIQRLQDLQKEVLAAIAGNPDERRARREIDLLPERLLFGWMSELRRESGRSPLDEASLIARCRSLLGDDKTWLPQYKEASSEDRARLVVVLTWQCETRCTYCSIPKQSGREMSREVLDSAIELLSSADKPKLELRFFGGEPMMEWEMIQAGIETATSLCSDRDVRFMITTNGYALTPDRMRWLSQYPVHVQVALDGLPDAHNRFRRSIIDGEDSYDHSAIDKADLFHELGLDYDVIQVVHPARIQRFVEDFCHIADQGFRRIQINWAHNMMWRDKDIEAFKAGLHTLGPELRRRWDRGDALWVTNLGETLQRVRTNREVTVDWDGGIYANNAVLYRAEAMETLRIGHIDEAMNWLHYRLTAPTGDDLMGATFAEPVHRNNAQVGAVMNSWVRWMNSQGIPDRP
jgi:sulfatase maturation enzyme AslB (radical SAM superfamily)